MAVSKTGTPYVVYAFPGQATVMRLNGSEWEVVGARAVPGGWAEDIAIRIDSKDIPYIAGSGMIFGASGPPTPSITVKGLNPKDGSWIQVENSPIPSNIETKFSFGLDPKDIPFLGLQSISGAGVVMTPSGGTWEELGGGPFSNSASSITVGADGLGRIFAAYCDVRINNKLSVRAFDGKAWVTVGKDGISSQGANSPSMELDRNGVPFISFEDESMGQNISVMKASFDP